MRATRPTIQTVKISDARQQLNRLVRQVAGQGARVVVEKGGVPVAGIVSADDVRRLDQLDREREQRFEALAVFGEAFKDVPVAEQERDVARAIAEIRAEDDALSDETAEAKARRFA